MQSKIQPANACLALGSVCTVLSSFLYVVISLNSYDPDGETDHARCPVKAKWTDAQHMVIFHATKSFASNFRTMF